MHAHKFSKSIMKSLSENKFNQHQSGFALVEVLVAVIVLAIGLLGLAGLHASGFRDNHGAFVRTQATYAVNDLADRMRANRVAAIAGNYEVVAAPTAPTFNCVNDFTGTSTTGICSPTEMATADLVAWYAFLGNALPGGTATITCNPVGCGLNAIHTITVTWTGNQSIENTLTGAQSVAASFRP